MARVIVIDGATYEYRDADWEQLIAGEMDAPANVLRYIIKGQLGNVLQSLDEIVYRDDIIEQTQQELVSLRMRVTDLENEQRLGWETKPARKKKKELA